MKKKEIIEAWKNTDPNDLPGEEWKDIPKLEGRYYVSNFGRIQSNNKIRKLQDNGNGYLCFMVKYNKKHKNFYVHRSVLSAFLYEADDKQVNHKDFNIKNNHIDNLEWTSIKQNMNHSRKHNRFDNANKQHSKFLKEKTKSGTNPFQKLTKEQRKKAISNRKKNYKKEKHPFYNRFGEQSSRNILTEKQILEIRAKYIPRKYTIHKLAKEYAVSYSAIHSIICKKTWKHI